jgi:hypothetical protein
LSVQHSVLIAQTSPGSLHCVGFSQVPPAEHVPEQQFDPVREQEPPSGTHIEPGPAST